MADDTILMARGIAVHGNQEKEQVAVVMDIVDENNNVIAHTLGVLDLAGARRLGSLLFSVAAELEAGKELPEWAKDTAGRA